LLRQGIDPSIDRQAKKAVEGGADSFESVAREWFGKFSPNWALSHSNKLIRRLEKDLFTYLETRPIEEIASPDLLAVLRRIEAWGP